ncbi:endonuclease MutS2 [Deltaproteobacteria bacterium]|nr:endonuclease MutS2 [Deltaproteobacteria bacterium]
MDERAVSLLELPKVLAHLASFAVSESGKTAALALRPHDSLAKARYASDWFSEGRIWQAGSDFVLPSFPCLDGVFAVLENSALPLDADAFWFLRQTLLTARDLAASLKTSLFDSPGGLGAACPLLLERANALVFPRQSVAALSRCLSDDGLLRDEASPELNLARSQIRSLYQTVTRKAKDFIQKHGLESYLQDDFMTLSSDRYVLPLKANFKGRVPGVIHDYSQTGETCYFEPVFLMEVNNRLQELKREERAAEWKVYQYLSGLIREEVPAIREAYALLVDMDVNLAVAAFSARYGGECADFAEDAPLILHGVLHPLLLIEHKASPKTIPAPEPIDLLLKKGQRALIISGGNAGGKTVSLKTLGITALMGLCGLPVLAKRGASLPFWRNVQVFMGDEQSLEAHLSTFSAQIRNLAKIWDDLDADSLILLDEFGAGTDPAQGAALAQAVMDGILAKNAFVVAATHFPALKAYALSKPGVRAASVLFEPKSKKPLYSLAYDQVGASLALDVAKEHGLPESILHRAEQILLLDGADTAGLIARLNALAVARQTEIVRLGDAAKKLAEKRRRLEEKFAVEREKLFAHIQEDARRILREWQMERINHKQALKELSQTRKRLLEGVNANRLAETERAGSRDFSPGMTVHYHSFDKNGLIREVDGRRKRLRLDLGGITIWADMADCVNVTSEQSALSSTDKDRGAGMTPGASAKTGSAGESGGSASGGHVLGRLDLRGLRADMAIAELERFLDAVIVAGQTEVEIIHGRGTGALRREVHTHLKNYPPVLSYCTAPEDRGGDGMTIVALK